MYTGVWEYTWDKEESGEAGVFEHKELYPDVRKGLKWWERSESSQFWRSKTGL